MSIESFKKPNIKVNLQPMAIVLIPAILAMVWCFSQTNIPYQQLLRDPNAISGTPAYNGLFSNLGILMWCIGGSVSLFTALTVKTKQPFLLMAGIFSMLLCIDDLFMLHEQVFVQFSKHSETVFYIAYAGLCFLHCLLYYRTKQLQRAPILIIAYLGLILSATFDTIISTKHEDAFKFVGIAAWMLFHVLASRDVLKRQLLSS